MRTKYEVIVEEIACAMEDHSFDHRWFFDIDGQETVLISSMSDCLPEEGHRLVPIDAMDSWESLNIMEDFVETVADKADQDKLSSALRQRHPFSAFKNMLHNTGQREKWFVYHDERMRQIVEHWMKSEEIVYKDGTFTCNSDSVFEYMDEE